MITPRVTRLVRVATLQAFRAALVRRACAGTPFDIRDRVLLVPTRAAGAHLLRTIEDLHVPGDGQASVLPHLATASELIWTLAERLPATTRVLTEAEREVLLLVAARAVEDAGIEAPFRLRPGLVAEMLRFHDALRRHRNTLDDFERRALDRLEPGAEYDRGAARLVLQTRFLAAAFREFERRAADAGGDEHAMRRRLAAEAAPRPWRHLVIAVADRAFDVRGLHPADWDLLTKVPGLETLEMVVTDTVLAGPLHERMHTILPGVEEVREEEEHEAARTARPRWLVPRDADTPLFVTRDREEEIALFARRVKEDVRAGRVEAERVALVVHQPLPYVYLAREVLRAAGMPVQCFDALPLASEPYAAALDLLFSFVSSGFARRPTIALLQSPHFAFHAEAGPLSPRDVMALDRLLAESGYLGELSSLRTLLEKWNGADAAKGRIPRALRAGRIVAVLAEELTPLRDAASASSHLALLTTFLNRHERVPDADARHLRARGAILATLQTLRSAYERFDPTPVGIDEVASLVRRWLDAQTFAPLTGDRGVHVVDAASAPFGAFDEVQLAGLVNGEWPERPQRNIFYSTSILRDFGWPSDADRLDGARSAFLDLLTLPSKRLVLSTFALEADALVSPSTLVDETARMALERDSVAQPGTLVFDYEQLAFDGVSESAAASTATPVEPHDRLSPALDAPLPAYSLSALERYQDCPFKFFASEILRLEEAPDDEGALSPRARGRFIHEVFQRFFEAWDATGHGTITSDRLDAARALFQETAEPLLARLPAADASLERTRLFGSPISVGIIDVVLGIEAGRPVEVRGRLLEHRFEGTFTLGGDGRQVALKGVADRIDLLAGRRLRVIDYKSGYGPRPGRALQVPIYALCAQERLTERDEAPWSVEEAAYVAFSGKRALVPVMKPGGADADESLGAARTRLFEVLDGIAGSEFPPRPHDMMICRYCAYASVCRKDYVGED